MSEENFAFKQFLYVSNLLSLLRIVLILPILYLLKTDTPTGNICLIILVLVIIATDYFDGYFSRSLNQVTTLGKLLDPLADKISIAVILVALIVYRDFPLPLVIILLYRDLVILVFGIIITRKSKIPSSNWWGKVNTCVFAGAGLFFILKWKFIFALFYYFSYLSILVSMVSYYIYGEKFFVEKRSTKYIFRFLFIILSLIILYLLLGINFFPGKPKVTILDSIILG